MENSQVNPENREEIFNAISAEYYIHYILQKYRSAEVDNKIKLLNALFNASLHTPGVITNIESCKTIQDILIYLRPKKGGNIFKNLSNNNHEDPTKQALTMNTNATDPMSYIDIRLNAIKDLYFDVKNPSHALNLLRYLLFFPEPYDNSIVTFQANIKSFVEVYKDKILSRNSVDDMLHREFVPTILWHCQLLD